MYLFKNKKTNKQGNKRNGTKGDYWWWNFIQRNYKFDVCIFFFTYYGLISLQYKVLHLLDAFRYHPKLENMAVTLFLSVFWIGKIVYQYRQFNSKWFLLQPAALEFKGLKAMLNLASGAFPFLCFASHSILSILTLDVIYKIISWRSFFSLTKMQQLFASALGV